MNIDTNFIEHNRHFMSTYFLPDPFELKVTFGSIMIGAFGTVTKGLLKGLEDLGN